MPSSDKYNDPPPPYTPFVPHTFQDPFASVEGGIGNLSISTELNGSHASFRADSTISVQSSNSDQDIDSTDDSRTTSATSPVSRESSPAKPSDSKDNGEETAVPLMVPPSRDNNDFGFPYPELDPFECPENLIFSESLEFDPDVTPRPTSRNSDTECNASLDGGADFLKSHGMAARLSSIPFTTSPASITRSVSIATSSIQSFRSVDDLDEWNTETLREMTDVVREALRAGSIPSAEMEILTEILTVLFNDELSMNNMVDIHLIALTYFDKLLDAIIAHIPQESTMEEVLLDVQSRATSLQHKWQQRFKEKYFSIDDYRINDMRQRALRDLTLDLEDWKTGQPWLVQKNEPISHKEGDLGFESGSWWLNMACAFRDGIIGGVEERVTKGPYIVTALPLLSGEEVEGPTLNMYEYIKKGTVKEMPFGLLGNRGGPIRLLRGYTLKSKFAPKIGVRYDGLHVVKQYGHKLVDENKNIYQCRLILERLTGQKSINEVLHYPTPSQLDDWTLYNRIIGEHIRARQGDVAYSEWRQFQEAQTFEKEEYIQNKALEASLPRYKVLARRKINSEAC